MIKAACAQDQNLNVPNAAPGLKNYYIGLANDLTQHKNTKWCFYAALIVH
jgi:hypothetical protein